MINRTGIEPHANQFSLKALISNVKQGKGSEPPLNHMRTINSTKTEPKKLPSGSLGTLQNKVIFAAKTTQADPGATWREWLDNCPRYPGGCFSCRAAVLDLTYFCQEANRAVYGADMIEPVKEDAQ